MNALLIVYEDNEIIIAEKPGGIPVHPSKLHQGDTLADMVREHLKLSEDEFTFRCLTRLDKDTSGLVLIAKTLEAAQNLNRQMTEKKILREYEAIVEDDGSLSDEGIIDAPIARASENVHDIRRCVRDDGEYAMTRYSIIERSSGTVRVRCILETGRTHQIRVHMAHIGHPIVGDVLYNDNYSNGPMKLKMIHLAFTHPTTGKALDYYSASTDSPTKRIYEAVKRIPKGKVATYAQIAAMAGNERMARAVGNALHKNPEPGIIPCHRVVDSKGNLAGAFAFGGEKVQEDLLKHEGVIVIDGRVDLQKYQM